VSLNSGQERAEVEVRHHRIVIREGAITVDGVTKDIQTFSRVVIHVTTDAVTVTVDGAPLFA
jgi:hypothetical protein